MIFPRLGVLSVDDLAFTALSKLGTWSEPFKFRRARRAVLAARLGGIASLSIAALAVVLAVWLSIGQSSCVRPTTLPWLICD